MKLSEFEDSLIKKISSEYLQPFPDHFIEGRVSVILELPQKPLMKGSELFGNYEIIDIDGNIVLTTDNLDKVKYILYSNRNFPTSVKIPKEDNELKLNVKEYERHLDEVIKMVQEDFIKHFADPSKFTSTINKIFQRLKLQRH